MPSEEKGTLLSPVLPISGDAKGKIPCGEPGYPVSTGVRESSQPPTHIDSAAAASAIDHAIHRVNIVPMGNLIQIVPSKLEDSWREGQLHLYLPAAESDEMEVEEAEEEEEEEAAAAGEEEEQQDEEEEEEDDDEESESD